MSNGIKIYLSEPISRKQISLFTRTSKFLVKKITFSTNKSLIIHPNKVYKEETSLRSNILMKSHIQILSSRSSMNGASFLLHFDDKSYLFNPIEGIQKILLEAGVKLSKICAIFLTQTNWTSFGGICGLLLSISTISQLNSRIEIYGGPNTMRLLCSLRHFMPKVNLEVSCKDLVREDVFTDQKIRVTAISSNFLGGSHLSEKEVEGYTKIISHMTEDATILEKKLLPKKKKRSSIDQMESSVKRFKIELENKFNIIEGVSESIPPIEEIKYSSLNQTTSYLVQGPEIRGRFHPNKATTLGIKPGKKFGILASGNPVINDKNEIVYPHQVMDPSINGFLFLVIDCPSIEDIPLLINDEFYSAYHATPEGKGVHLNLIIHILGKGVVYNEKYREWTKKFGENVKHCLSIEEYEQLNPVYKTSTKLQKTFNIIDPDIYAYKDIPNSKFTFPIEWKFNENYSISKDFMVYNKLEGSPELDASKCLEISSPSECFSENIKGLKAYTNLCEEVNKRIQENFEFGEGFEKDVVVCTLGTGSASPSLSRNVSGNLVYCDNLTLMLDCGEDTKSQMCRISEYKEDSCFNIKHVFETLQVIFISHAHADHHMGLIGVLEMRKKFFETVKTPPPNLYIISPIFLNNFLNEFNDLCDILVPNVFIINSSQLYLSTNLIQSCDTALKFISTQLNLRNISLVPVNHCRYALAIVVRFNNGRSIAYSGDCRPTPSLSNEAYQCDVFIHEATFDDSDFGLCEAIKKRHCTSSEALDIINKSNCKLSILTHFSQRYPLVPPLISSLNKDPFLDIKINPYLSNKPIISVASDLMSVKLSNAWKLPYYYEILMFIKNTFQNSK